MWMNFFSPVVGTLSECLVQGMLQIKAIALRLDAQGKDLPIFRAIGRLVTHLLKGDTVPD